MSLKDPNWKYDSAEASRKPGYLARKFAKLRREQAIADAKKAPDNVRELAVKPRIKSGNEYRPISRNRAMQTVGASARQAHRSIQRVRRADAMR